VDTVDGRYSTGRIIEMVQAGDIKYTIADENIASINASYYPDLDIGTQVSFSQRAAWALRKSSPELRDTINDWIKAMRKEAEYYVIYNKYFKNTRSFRTREASNFYSSNDESEGQLSPYDELIKEYAENLGWDWRFLSAQVYQESQFDPGASSWANAEGLMQLMPATARSYGITDRSDPEQSLRGGTEFLADLWEEWSGIPDSLQRLKFTLASFNCGLYHVKDAVALAEAEGDDPTQWDNSVEDWVLNLTYPEHHNRPEVKYGYVRGQEPVQYVRQIFDRYQRYQTLLPNQEVRM
jgi:membrane-bound lytic murein transglycosylase F